MSKGPISQFIEKHYLHFNSAALVDAAKAYEEQLAKGAKMMVSMAGAMSTAEIGKIFSDIILSTFVTVLIKFTRTCSIGVVTTFTHVLRCQDLLRFFCIIILVDIFFGIFLKILSNIFY